MRAPKVTHPSCDMGLLMHAVASANRWPAALEALQNLLKYVPGDVWCRTLQDVRDLADRLKGEAPPLVLLLTGQPVDPCYRYTPEREPFRLGDRVGHTRFRLAGTVIPTPASHAGVPVRDGFVWVLFDREICGVRVLYCRASNLKAAV